MRISVCEFLRLQTGRNWFYYNPGHWISDGLKVEAIREEDGVFRLFSNGKPGKTLEYFEGLPSNDVRVRNRRRLQQLKKRRSAS